MAPKSLLILRLSALGDVIHTMPAVALLRKSFPEARMAWVVEAPYAEMIQLALPGVSTIPVRTRRWRSHPAGRETRRELSAALRAMREIAGGETSLDFQGLIKSAILGRLSGAADRYGFAAEAIREKAALMFINAPVRVDRSRHVVDWNLQLASGAFGLTGLAPEVDLGPFATDPEGILTPLVALRPVVLAPGAGQPRKQWPSERFADLATRLSHRGVPVVVAWGPGERHLAEEIVAGAPDAIVAPPTTLGQLASLLSKARVLIAGDTGPLHLADALGTAVVGLYGPTDPNRNGPWKQVDRCVESWTGERSMEAITTDDVMTRLESIL